MGDRWLGDDPDDLPTTMRWARPLPDGTTEWISMAGPSINEQRRRWRKVELEPRLLAVLRARLAQLGGGAG